MRLGGAVLVLQHAARKPLEEGHQGGRHLELLAGRHHLAQRTRHLSAVGHRVGQGLEGDERKEQSFHRVRVHEGQQGGHVLAQAAGGQYQGAASPPGAEQLLEGDVEAERGELERGGGGIGGLAQLPRQQVAKGAVGKRDALGPAGAAGGVDEVAGGLGGHLPCRCVSRLS